MVDGNLECQYHGWQFGKEGKCEKSNYKFNKKFQVYQKIVK
jgi:phenylpropionate dioxygenase-like ring-hydroxylating dioxygenase large terminal subunit